MSKELRKSISMNVGHSEFQAGAGGETFGDLLKALSASGQGGADGSPLIPEDLEMEAYSVLWREEHLKLLRMLPIIRARAIQHEFSRITGYTGADTEGWLRDGGTPNSYEFASERATEQIRPIGERFSVTGMMGSVQVQRALGQSDVVSIQRTAKLLGLQQKMIRALYFANTLGLAIGATPKFRGMEQIVTEDAASENTIDVAGKTLVQNNFDSAGEIIMEAYGTLTHVCMAPVALKNYTRTVENVRQVIGIPENYSGAGFAGIRINAVRHSFGESDLMADVFLAPKFSRYKPAPKYTATKNPKPDNAPTAVADGDIALGSPGVDALSKFTATDVSEFGTYYYAVVADNSHSVALDKTGESTPTIKGGGTPTGTAIAAGKSLAITITNSAGVLSYRFYRAIKASLDLADYQFIGEVVDSSSGAGTGTSVFTDRNDIISHTKDSLGNIAPTTVAFALTLPTYRDTTKAGAQMKMTYPGDVPDAVKRIDLAPIFPRPQAILGDIISDELLLWYGAVEIPTPDRVVVLRNIGNRNL